MPQLPASKSVILRACCQKHSLTQREAAIQYTSSISFLQFHIMVKRRKLSKEDSGLGSEEEDRAQDEAVEGLEQEEEEDLEMEEEEALNEGPSTSKAWMPLRGAQTGTP